MPLIYTTHEGCQVLFSNFIVLPIYLPYYRYTRTQRVPDLHRTPPRIRCTRSALPSRVAPAPVPFAAPEPRPSLVCRLSARRTMDPPTPAPHAYPVSPVGRLCAARYACPVCAARVAYAVLRMPCCVCQLRVCVCVCVRVCVCVHMPCVTRVSRTSLRYALPWHYVG